MTQDEAKKKSSYFTATSGNLATTRIADATSVLYAFIKDGTAANALIINGSNTEATIGNNASYNCGIILATAETRTVGTDVVDELNDIKGRFPEALAVDMESGAIAQTCHLYSVPFISFRIISDTPGADGHWDQYLNFWDTVADRSFRTTCAFLSCLPQTL